MTPETPPAPSVTGEDSCSQSVAHSDHTFFPQRWCLKAGRYCAKADYANCGWTDPSSIAPQPDHIRPAAEMVPQAEAVVADATLVIEVQDWLGHAVEFGRPDPRIIDLVDRALSALRQHQSEVEALRSQLSHLIEWVPCPFCRGASPSFEPSRFCEACGQDGKVLKGTANILNNILPFREATEARATKAEADLAEAIALLRRYRNETPAGHSPHMICHKADQFLTRQARDAQE